MVNEQQKPEDHQDDLKRALESVHENDHQDLSKETLGDEPDEQAEGKPNNPHHLKGLEDKRPEDDDIKKGWTVDSNTSRGPQDLTNDDEDFTTGNS